MTLCSGLSTTGIVTEASPTRERIAGMSERELFFVRYMKFLFIISEALRLYACSEPSEGMYGKFLNSMITSKMPIATPVVHQYDVRSPIETGIIKGPTWPNISKVMTIVDIVFVAAPPIAAAPTTAYIPSSMNS